MRENYFVDLKKPKIYAYTTPQYENQIWEGMRTGKGLIKVGYTELEAKDRIAQQFGVLQPIANPWSILHVEEAITESGKFFSDHAVHKNLIALGAKRLANSEWFECTIDEVKAAITALKLEQHVAAGRMNKYAMRPEQIRAVEKTSNYFKSELIKKNKPPHFLWNAKMRFGKTFTTYQLANQMNWKRIMVLTYKPAVEREWRNELDSHVDFENWKFFSRDDDPTKFDESEKSIWFASFQDILGKTADGKLKKRFEKARKIEWDCIVLDEYHFGAWRDAAKELYDADNSGEKPIEEFNEDAFPLKAKTFLYLSGTPFRALANGEFLEDQIFSWSYPDEQKAKLEWNSEKPNPYLDLPEMILLTYKMPEGIRKIALKGELNEFDLAEFFKAEENPAKLGSYRFIHESYVQKWISLIRGQYLQDNFAPDGGIKKPPMPFGDLELLNYLNHTLWLLPNVAACYAMGELLKQPANIFFNEYKIIVAAGKQAKNGVQALPPVLEAIGKGFETKSITLTCGKLTTGVSVPQWSGMFMLSNTNSPETYFQAAFRVQSPWAVRNVDETEKLQLQVVKEKCYIFDFAPNRALNLITEYSSRLGLNDKLTVEERIEEFLKFLPVLAFDDFSMQLLDAKELMDFAASGVGASMLARRWQSFHLVRIDNDTIEKLLANPNLLANLEKIEAFRNLSNDLTKVINREEALNKKDREKKPKTKKDLEDAKENRNLKKEIREKLLKFIGRVPVFMYLTDFREESLHDVISQLETNLFTRVTGLTLEDFESLCNLGVFNSNAMNSAIFSFRRFEEGSLGYAGNAQKLKRIGLFDTSISAIE
jgi:hypothetical protein